MKYFVTAKSLPMLKDLLGQTSSPLEDSDQVIVFYKASDTVKMEDVAMLWRFLPELVETDDRDDMLIYLGGWFVQNDDSVTILDPTIPVPKMYADRVTCLKPKAPARSRSKGSRKKQVEPNVPEMETTAEASEPQAILPEAAEPVVDSVLKPMGTEDAKKN